MPSYNSSILLRFLNEGWQFYQAKYLMDKAYCPKRKRSLNIIMDLKKYLKRRLKNKNRH